MRFLQTGSRPSSQQVMKLDLTLVLAIWGAILSSITFRVEPIP